MAIKSLQHSSITDNIFYSSMLAGNAAFDPGDEDILAEQVLSSSAASVTFSGLDTLAAGYQHLQIRMVARSDDSGSSNLRDLRIQVNADTGTNYSSHVLRGDGASVSSNAASSQDSINTALSMFPRPSNPTTQYGAAIIDVLDAFETTKYTTIRMLGGAKPDGEDQIWLGSGLWQNTNALTEIKIFANVGNLAGNSRFTLIGLK